MQMMIYSANVGKLGREQLEWILRALFMVPQGSQEEIIGRKLGTGVWTSGRRSGLVILIW